MNSVITALLPDLALLCVGAIIRRSITDNVWSALDKLNFQILFPALIFTGALRHGINGADILTIGAGVWSGMAFACALGWIARPIWQGSFLDFAGLWQTTWRFNTAIALVLVQGLPEHVIGMMSAAIGLAVPLANVLAVSALTHGQGMSLRQMVAGVFSNPFLIAGVAGITLSLFGVSLAEVPLRALGKLADAAVPLALLSIGASLSWQSLTRLSRLDVIFNAIKLIILPIATFSVASLIGLQADILLVLTLFAALPTASASHVLASAYGANRTPVANLVAQSTIISCITVPLWLMFLS